MKYELVLEIDKKVFGFKIHFVASRGRLADELDVAV